MADTKLRIGKKNAAVIVRDDGGVEVVTPNLPPERMPESGMIAHILFEAALRPEVVRELLHRLAKAAIDHERLN